MSSNILVSRKYTRKIINIEQIKVKKTFNSGRKLIGDTEDNILLKSIKMTGQPIHDILVRPILRTRVKKGKIKKTYELVVGGRRLEVMILNSARFIHFEIPNKYVNLHVKAIRRENMKSTTLARKIYLQWLEEVEKEDGIIQELDAELNRLKYS